MRIQHNIMAMNAYRNYTNNANALSGNLEKLSSGYKINRAGDDAAGLAISEKMRAQITGLEAAQKNVKDGISLVKTGEGAMQEIQDMLNRMDYLATQSANGTYDNEVDRANLQKEVDSLKSEINRIADSANFNGIKLLDGSLADNAEVRSVIVKGTGDFTYEASDASKGEYKTINNMSGLTGGAANEGDYIEVNVGLSDGTSKTVKLTFVKEDNKDASDFGALKYLEAEDGTRYKLSGGYENDPTDTTGAFGKVQTFAAADLDNALAKELKKTGLGDQFVVSVDNTGAGTDGIKLTAKEAGTETPRVLSFDVKYKIDGEEDNAGSATATKLTNPLGIQETEAMDAGIEIKAESITEFDGTNYDDAVFTINGHKFLLLSENLSAKDGATDDDKYVKAMQGVGSDVHILIGGVGGLKTNGGTPAAPGTQPSPGGNAGAAANSNFEQNIKKIAEVTGLKVTDAKTEGLGGVDNGIDPGDGIRLSANGSTVKGGLTLQIGDTADSYNQMKVAIGDMHTKAMGIDSISIAKQESAAAAIDKIKSAINYVSGVRGDLGAVQNRLEHTANNLSVMAENIQDAESTIRDTDVAEEMMSYVKNNILVQSAQAMLAQANQVPQGVLQLLG